MASDFGLFIGFGLVKPGREKQALEVFAEAQQFNEKLKQRGEIDSYETVLLELHGGDLGGFTLLRGTADKLNRLRYQDQEFLGIVSRASLLVDDFGVVGATIGDGIQKQMGIFQEAIRSLQPMAAAAR
ncbi:MAG: hypothetical protein E6I56_06680 [Chloroflexi bacterium]|nr:MAG: hypothetical protein E6I56_06680 [Chloroflexota bacterium]